MKLSVHSRLVFFVLIAGLVAFVVLPNLGRADSLSNKPDSSRVSVQSQSKFTPSALSLVVNRVGDGHDANPGDGVCEVTTGNGNCTLRAAIEEYEASASGSGSTITFNLSSLPAVINLGSQLPNLTKNLTISGTVGMGLNPITVRGNDSFTIITVNSGVTVNISNLNIEGGAASTASNGGGITNLGTLILDECSIDNNSAVSGGGGILSAGGSVTTINNSSIFNNVTTTNGSGIFGSASSTVNLNNSTVASNTGGFGGIQTTTGTMTITSSTITNNDSSGIQNNLGSITLYNTISARNNGFDLWGAFISNGNNLISITSHETGITDGVNGDIVTSFTGLAPLGDYGGPTPTVALINANFFTFSDNGKSKALNAGNNTGAPATDQRGLARPFDTTVDIGAFEAKIDSTPLDVPDGEQNVLYNTSLTGINGTFPYTFTQSGGTLPTGITLSSGGVLSGTTTQSGSFLISVKVTDSTGLSGVHDYVLQLAAAPTQLAITAVHGGTDPIAGVPFQVTVQSQDSGGTPSAVLADTQVILSLNTGTGALSGTLTGTIPAGSKQIFMSVKYSKADSGVSLTVTRTSGDNLTAGDSAPFTVDQAFDLFTDPAGSCSGLIPCYTSIQTAIDSSVPSGGTINILGGTYNEGIDFNASATYKINNNVHVNNITLTSGTLNFVGAASVTIDGNWTRNGGTFNPGTGTVIVTNAGTIGGVSSTTFNNLTINSSVGDVTLARNQTVNGVLTLSSNLNTGSFALNMTGTASSAGSFDVIGVVNRTGLVSGGSAVSFGNPLNTIQINSGPAPTSIFVKLTQTVPTDASTGETNSGFPNAVQRTYVIVPSSNGFSATLKLHYRDTELNGNSEGSLNLWRFDSATGKWNNMGASAHDTTNNAVTQTGITQFSLWTLNSVVPTAVDFDSASVSRIGNSALIEWKTGMEVNNLGFNIYRQSGSERVKINPSVIAGSALMVGSDVRVEAGNGYMWTDSAGDASASYWIEDLDLNGSSVWHGPFGVTQSKADNSKANSGLLSELNQSIQNTAVVQREYPAGMPIVTGSTVSTTATTSGRTPNRPMALPSALTKQWSIAAQPALKIAVNKTGWHHLNAVDLIAAGLDSNLSPSTLQIFLGGLEIPIKVNAKNPGFLSADDSIEFYGSAIDTPSSDTQIYWLVSGSNGKRIGTVQSPGAANGSGPASFLYTVERKDRSLYFSSLRNGDTENWFGAVVNSNAVSQSLNIHHLDQNSVSPAEIEIALQGVTINSHQVNVMLNGSAIESVTFDGMTHKTVKVSIPQSSLIEGANQIALAAQGTGDVSLIDYIRITYAHSYAADSNSLFTSAAMQPVQIGGFTSNQITAVDVTNPNQPVEVEGTIAGEAGNYSISIGPAKRRNLLVFTPDQMLQPVSITANKPSTLNKSSNGADYLIITHKDLSQSVQPFAVFKESEGYQVKVIYVDSIYDEFSYGVHTPQALKDFLNWSYLHWAKQPQYVLLAGSGSLDPRNYTATGYQDFVPAKLIDTSNMETASDDWFVDFNNDGLPQMSIGRLPVRTAAEAASVVNKIINYEQSGHTSAMVLVSDTSDNADFSAPNTRIKSMAPPNLPVVNIVRGQQGTDPKTELMSQLSQGERILNYAGHGSVNLWRGNLLTSNDVQTLANHKASPLVVTMTCLNGYFQDSRLASLGESLLKVNQGGAVSVWASSGMTDNTAQTTMNQVFFMQLFGNTNITLGQAIRAAKAAAQDNDVRRTWILFGDPTMRIK